VQVHEHVAVEAVDGGEPVRRRRVQDRQRSANVALDEALADARDRLADEAARLVGRRRVRANTFAERGVLAAQARQ
jgi:hypothetical protein